MNKRVSALVAELLRVSGSNLSSIAKETNLRRQFLYDLRDGHVRSANKDGRRLSPREDQRYLTLNGFFEEHGITNFLDVVDNPIQPSPLAASAEDDWLEAAMEAVITTQSANLSTHRGLAMRALAAGFTPNPTVSHGVGGLLHQDPPGTQDLLQLLKQTCPDEIPVRKRLNIYNTVLEGFTSAFAQRAQTPPPN